MGTRDAAVGPCTLCGSTERYSWAMLRDNRSGSRMGTFTYLRCRSCAFISLHPLPDLDGSLSGHERAGVGIVEMTEKGAASDALREGIWVRLARRVWHLADGMPSVDRLPIAGRVLDVGAGTGEQVEALAGLGFDAVGLEPNSQAVALAQMQGRPVLHGTAEDPPFGDASFDTVILSQVVEHLVDPIGALRSLRRLVRPGGRLIVLTPNVHGVPRRLFRSEWAHWYAPYHTHLFGPSQIRDVLEQAGYRVRRVTTLTPSFWVNMSVQLWRHHSQRTGWVLPSGRWQLPHLVRIMVAAVTRPLDALGRGDCLVAIATPDRDPGRVTDGPLVSIITPTLDQARYIRQTIQSVQDQSYRAVEHVVVDGGSMDGTLEILEQHAEMSELVWTSGPDAGMYDAVNKGLGLARGEILAYLNSDDMYLPWTVRTAVEFLQAHPEVDLVYGDYMSLDEARGGPVPLLQPPYRPGYIRRTGFIPQPTTFWRRSLYERIGGFDAELQFVGDCDYWMRAAAVARIAKVDEILAVDRIQPGAKRSREWTPLEAELAHVRSRHRRPGDRGRRWLDRAYAALWRRIQLLRLLAVIARHGRPAGRWAGLLSGYVVRPHLRPLALSLVPVVGVRYLATALELRPRRSSPRDRSFKPVVDVHRD